MTDERAKQRGIAPAYVAGLAVLVACAEHRHEHVDKVPRDAAIVVEPGYHTPIAIAGLGDAHLDDDVPRHASGANVAQHVARPIDVTLHSTPPGAQALVDGVFVGVTPTFWNGQADGREHEFVFMRRGHVTARYRFVPVTSGVIHARLERMSEEPDAGMDDPTELPGVQVPSTNPMLVNPPPAPEMVKPSAAGADANVEPSPGPGGPAGSNAGPQP
jgi:hypothetical protein